jgi:hypothetical protein
VLKMVVLLVGTFEDIVRIILTQLFRRRLIGLRIPIR